MPRTITLAAAFIILVCLVSLSGCAKKEAPPLAGPVNATPVHGQVLRDGGPVADAIVEAVSIDGSQKITNRTDGNGSYVLGLQPRVWYMITATSGNLKHAQLPAIVPETGNWTDNYDINLSAGSTIEGIPAPDSPFKGKGVYVVAAPADGGEPVMTLTGDDGHFSIPVRSGIYYALSAFSYDPFGTPFSADMYYRNSIGCTMVKLEKGETILLEYFARRPALDPATPVALVVNGTVGVLHTKVEPPARVMISPVLSGGRVLVDNETIRGAHVEAVSIDGADRVSATTNDTGVYLLKLEPGVMYRATATYKGMSHTIWPVSQAQNLADGRNDIRLTSAPRSTIAVLYDDDHPYQSMPALIEAVPADGSSSVAATTNGSWWYYLDVKPGMKYSLRGRCYDPWGQNAYAFFNYPQDSSDRAIILDSDETIIASMRLTFVHPPMIISMWRDPATGSYDPFKPSVPVTVTGRIFLDDRPASGANVSTAVSSSSGTLVSTFADENGTYTLTLMSRRQYGITASWGGWVRTVRPVIVQDNMTGVFDIRLMRTPGPVISGSLDPDQKWPVMQGNVITASPVGGIQPVTAITDASGRFSLEVKPLTYYDISGKSTGTDGETHRLRFHYTTGVSCEGFMLRPDETVLINYYVE